MNFEVDYFNNILVQVNNVITVCFSVFIRAAWKRWGAGSSQIMALFWESALVWLSLRYVVCPPAKAL